MTYLISQILTCLILAALFGLLIGWLIWGSLLRRLRQELIESHLQISRLNMLPAKLNELEDRHRSLILEREADANKFASRSAELEQSLAVKDADLKSYGAQIAQLEARLANAMANASDTSEKALLEEQLAQQAYDNAAKDSLIKTLTSQLSGLNATADRVPQLESALQSKDLEIADHLRRHAYKDAQFMSLFGRVAELEPLTARVTELESTLDERELEIAKHVEAHAVKDAGIAELTTKVADLSSKLQPGAIDSSPNDNEIEDLRARVHVLSAELQQTRQDYNTALSALAEARSPAQVSAETPQRSMAMAAGASVSAVANPFHATSTTTFDSSSNHVYERHIQELKQLTRQKDQELTELKSRIAKMEQNPEPATRHQIVLSAKEAQLKHLQGVLNSLFEPLDNAELAQRAFIISQHRDQHSGTPQEDWARAERDLKHSRLLEARDLLKSQGVL